MPGQAQRKEIDTSPSWPLKTLAEKWFWQSHAQQTNKEEEEETTPCEKETSDPDHWKGTSGSLLKACKTFQWAWEMPHGRC